MSRESDCTNHDGSSKRAYRSRATAERIARRQRHDRPGEFVHAYYCPNIRPAHFHIGHPGFDYERSEP